MVALGPAGLAAAREPRGWETRIEAGCEDCWIGKCIWLFRMESRLALFRVFVGLSQDLGMRCDVAAVGSEDDEYCT